MGQLGAVGCTGNICGVPVALDFFDRVPVFDIGGGQTFTYILLSNGSIFTSGRSDFDQVRMNTMLD